MPERTFMTTYASDQPAAVRGDWRAVLVDQDGFTIGFDRWMDDSGAWAGEGPVQVGVVRDTATPLDTNDNGVGAMPTHYHPDDVLYLHDGLEGADAIARWAQARLVAALLADNDRRLRKMEGVSA